LTSPQRQRTGDEPSSRRTPLRAARAPRNAPYSSSPSRVRVRAPCPPHPPVPVSTWVQTERHNLPQTCGFSSLHACACVWQANGSRLRTAPCQRATWSSICTTRVPPLYPRRAATSLPRNARCRLRSPRARRRATTPSIPTTATRKIAARYVYGRPRCGLPPSNYHLLAGRCLASSTGKIVWTDMHETNSLADLVWGSGWSVSGDEFLC
jgi:hypothetical protein